MVPIRHVILPIIIQCRLIRLLLHKAWRILAVHGAIEAVLAALALVLREDDNDLVLVVLASALLARSGLPLVVVPLGLDVLGGLDLVDGLHVVLGWQDWGGDGADRRESGDSDGDARGESYFRVLGSAVSLKDIRDRKRGCERKQYSTLRERGERDLKYQTTSNSLRLDE